MRNLSSIQIAANHEGAIVAANNKGAIIAAGHQGAISATDHYVPQIIMCPLKDTSQHRDKSYKLIWNLLTFCLH